MDAAMIYKIAVVLLSSLVALVHPAIFTDKWAVHIDGDEQHAKHVAEEHGFIYLDQILPGHYHFQHRHVVKRSLRPNHQHHQKLHFDSRVKWAEQQTVRHRVKRDLHVFSDPYWPSTWYLKPSNETPGMNVMQAWRRGFTGRGVVITFLDDGIETTHPDLVTNYDPEASYDMNDMEHDPTPRYDFLNSNRHGTRCAGEAAAEADNMICGVGVAYNAKVGGIRMLDGDVTDVVEARSLAFNPQHIDIYTISWGPDDDGRTVEGPGRLAAFALEHGILYGRGGLGSIYIWASGNGGRSYDSCSCDGYVNSIYTVAVSSTSQLGDTPWYSEPCASTLASTYSSGSASEGKIVTTDLRQSCTTSFTGTSASAPLAAGMCALVLQANTKLTWRDIQHIIVQTARSDGLHANDWVINGIGRNVSHWYGYGLMDAAAMVELAQNWTTVLEHHRCSIRWSSPAAQIPKYQVYRATINTDGCRNTSQNRVTTLEHVQVALSLSSSRRGELSVYLTSPQGTTSTLLPRRKRDVSIEGFRNWTLMTTHNWGEHAHGRWTLEVSSGDSLTSLEDWTLILYGTDRDKTDTSADTLI